MKKYVREDGDVAVLISPGYGAGWSTWSHSNSDICFDYEVVQWVLDDKPTAEEFIEKTAERLDVYAGGMRNLEVVWFAPGTRFRIEEYDGYESIVFENDLNWMTA